MKYNPSSEANSLTSHEITRTLRIPKIHYCVHKIQTTVPVSWNKLIQSIPSRPILDPRRYYPTIYTCDFHIVSFLQPSPPKPSKNFSSQPCATCTAQILFLDFITP